MQQKADLSEQNGINSGGIIETKTLQHEEQLQDVIDETDLQQIENIEDSQSKSIEDELKAIFKEEADEQYHLIFQQYDKWKENIGNGDSLREMRRAFHTLKGSGRMVGATVIGDFFWAFENLFNKLIEEKIAQDDAFTVLVETFIAYLQANKEGLLHAKVQDEAIQRLISDAEKLSNNESIELFEKVANVVVLDETTTNEIDAKGIESVKKTVESESNNVGDEATKKAEVLDPLFALYLEEFAELLEAFELTTQALVDDPTDAEAIAGAERQLHTIKGGARMTGLVAIGDLSHAGESLLSKVAQHKVDTDNQLLFKLQEVNDELYRMYEKASLGVAIEPATQLIEELQQLSGEKVLTMEPQQQDKSIVANIITNKTEEKDLAVVNVENKRPLLEEGALEVLDVPLDVPLSTSLADDDLGVGVQHTSDLEKVLAACADELSISAEILLPAIAQKQAEVDKHQVDTSSIKVSTKIINNLISTTHEWGDQNMRLVEQYEDNSNQIDELKRTTIRLKKQIRTLELETDSLIKSGNKVADLSRVKSSFDPLEMDEYSELQQQSRALAESLNDLESLTETLEGGLKTMEKTIDEQRASFKVLQDGLIRTRMMKITSLSSRLKRIVRQTATELGKKVELEIADEQCELDRTILERITASLEHLIRNSLAHGIEHPEQRLKNNKNEVGKIFLEFSREGPEVVITLQDDGQGIDIDKLKKMAISKGLINETTCLSDQEAYQLILKSGVSTANAISQISGRGVGMNVVNTEVNTLGGNIVIDSERGKFTRFTLRVPYNLATNQVMLLGVCDEIVALPIAKLEGMQRLSAAELARRYAMQAPSVNIGGRQYVLKHLGETLGLGTFDVHENEQDITYPLILLEENEQRIAYHVNEIKGSREVMLKPLGPLFDESQLLSSATIMSGRIVLLLNAHELIRMGVAGEAICGNKVKADLAQSKTKVLVVDDSITVRKITESLLTKLNYTVMTATDGLNALEVLEVGIPDIILLDIEMPRMDGFELLGRLRDSNELKHLPVIMISSRSGAKHKKHAEKLGATSFIGKPWEAKQLSNTIKSCLNNLLVESI
ncbi:MAG TPA: response regulator [Thiothrix sp.]|nr:response regulator [Thiothrix sp.]